MEQRRRGGALPDLLEELIEVEQDAVHARNYEAVWPAREFINFFDGDTVNFVVDVEAADVFAVAWREGRGG